MGISRFSRWIINKIKNKNEVKGVFKYGVLRKYINLLCIDCNGLIHGSAQKVFKYERNSSMDEREMINKEFLKNEEEAKEKYEKMLLEQLIKDIEEIIEYVTPDELYIAVDGIASESKMIQQRSRRYKTSIFKNEENKIWFDSNSISPGTELMFKIDRELSKWIKDNSKNFLRIRYSSHMVQGEGEHKIFDYLKEIDNIYYNKKYKVIIHGLDSDLIMLSLMIKNLEIYLLHENIDRNGKTRRYFDMNEFKKLLNRSMNPDLNKMDENIYEDFIIILYMIGNDFVPNMPGLEDRDFCIDKLMEIYKNLKSDDENYKIIIDKNINWTNLSKYIEQLYYIEELLLLDFCNNSRCKYRLKILDESVDGSKLEYNKFNDKWYDNIIEPKQKEYKKFLNIDKDEIVNDMCLNYCLMIEWMFNFYTKGTKHVNKLYTYRYKHTPLLRELSYFIKCNIDNFKELKSEPLNINNKEIFSYHQLIYILPPSSKESVPSFFQKLYKENSPIYDYFPTVLNYELEGKYADYEKVLLLPNISINRIIHECNKIENNMDENDLIELKEKYKEEKNSITKKKERNDEQEIIQNNQEKRKEKEEKFKDYMRNKAEGPSSPPGPPGERRVTQNSYRRIVNKNAPIGYRTVEASDITKNVIPGTRKSKK